MLEQQYHPSFCLAMNKAADKRESSPSTASAKHFGQIREMMRGQDKNGGDSKKEEHSNEREVDEGNAANAENFLNVSFRVPVFKCTKREKEEEIEDEKICVDDNDDGDDDSDDLSGKKRRISNASPTPSSPPPPLPSADAAPPRPPPYKTNNSRPLSFSVENILAPSCGRLGQQQTFSARELAAAAAAQSQAAAHHQLMIMNAAAAAAAAAAADEAHHVFLRHQQQQQQIREHLERQQRENCKLLLLHLVLTRSV